METTTNTVKNQIFSGKVREEIVEAIYNMSSSLKKCIYDPLIVLSMSRGAFNIKIK